MRKQKGFLSNSLVALTMIGALTIGARSQQQPAGQKDSAEQLRRAASTYYEAGWAEFGRGNIASAIEKYLESKRLFEEAHAKRDLIYILADLGTLYLYNSDYKTSRLYSEQSLALADQLKGSTEPGGAWPDEYGIGAAFSNLGNISRHDGEYDKAINYFQESIAAYHAIDNGGSKFRVEVLDNLADIGRTYLARGDSLRALNYLNQAMALAKGSDREAAICNSIGILYTNQRDYANAVEFFQRGLIIAIQRNDRFKQAEILLNVGVAYQFQQNNQSALNSFEQSLEVARAINYSELMVPIEEGRGTVLKAQGKYKEALDAFDRALESAKGKSDKTRIAELLWRKSEVELANGDVSPSIQNAKEAIKIAEELSLRNVRYLALTNLGKAYRAAGQNELAMQTFKEATSQIEEMRGGVAGLENERQLFFEDKVVPYHEIVDLLVSSNKVGSTEQALLTAESAKARVLLDVFSTGRIDLTKVMSDREKEEQNRLNKRIVELNNDITEENGKRLSDAARLKSLDDQLRSARAQYQTFQDSLYAAHPELRTNRSQSKPLTPGQINDLLPDSHTAFIEYVVTDSKAYLLVLTKSPTGETPMLRVYPIAIAGSEIAKRTRDFRDLITTQGGFADDARRLYDLLLKPAEQQLKGKKSLCIIPDGILWDLPFQALEPRDGHYLLEEYAISYAPSLSVLRQMSLRKKSDASTSLLAFGNPTTPGEIAASIKTAYRGEVLGPLPDAEMEVDTLRGIWGPSSSRILIGASARKNVFISEASKYNIIHFATHGILDDASPMYSRLVMARDENDRNDDGLLEAREIMQLNLHADLVVLSACQTARGRIGAGEGMIGMSWAFFVAGVPTMVVSQWKVNSGSTAKLMIDFHKRLRDESSAQSQTTAMALQQAALSVMKDPRYRHPYFWAGFVVMGKNPSSLSPRTNLGQ
jgi:CHAT domain-containing protein/type II secretory pathway pseudopilin PulG